MWLVLPLPSIAESEFKVDADKFHRIELVRFLSHSHPNKMQMIQHQTVGGANEIFTGGCMDHEFAESGMEVGREPTSSALLESIRPEDNCVSLVKMFLQSRQVSFFWRRHRRFDAVRLVKCQGLIKVAT